MVIENGTTPKIVFLLVDDGDGYTASTGKAPSAQISKNGGAFAAITDTITEIGNGWYEFDLTATETNTDGPIILRVTEASSLEWREKYEVKSSDAMPAEYFNRIADHVLRRAFASARASSYGDTIATYNALTMLLASGGINYIDGNLLITLQEDEVTQAMDREVETNSNALPIVGLRVPS